MNGALSHPELYVKTLAVLLHLFQTYLHYLKNTCPSQQFAPQSRHPKCKCHCPLVIKHETLDDLGEFCVIHVKNFEFEI